MTGFPLLSIAPALLEKTIKKLESKSYFRIRQTCRDANDFIRNTSNISIPWDGYCQFDKKRDLYVLNRVNYHTPTESSDVHFEALHGTRIASLSLFAPEETERYNQLCNLLKTHQITCREIVIRDGKWTAEQCATLLNVLKPESACLYNARAGLYESVLQQKTLKDVYVCLKSNAAAIAGAKLLAAGFEDLAINVTRTSTPFYLVHTILKILCSTPFPKMRKFTFYVDGRRDMPPNDEIEEKLRDGLRGQLRDFQAYRSVSAFDEEDVVTAAIDIPFDVSGSCTCKLTITDMFQSFIEYSRE